MYNIDFYLTKKANKLFNITNSNHHYFKLDKNECIYSSYNLLKNIEYINNYVFPGSIYYKKILNCNFLNYNIIGSYLLFNWKHYNTENEVRIQEDLYIKLISLYYIAILDHFFKIIKTKNNRYSILHLVQCHKELFEDIYQITDITNITDITDITNITNIYIYTVYGYLYIKRKTLSNYKFMISIDNDFNNNIKYEDIKYLSDIINEYEKK